MPNEIYYDGKAVNLMFSNLKIGERSNLQMARKKAMCPRMGLSIQTNLKSYPPKRIGLFRRTMTKRSTRKKTT